MYRKIYIVWANDGGCCQGFPHNTDSEAWGGRGGAGSASEPSPSQYIPNGLRGTDRLHPPPPVPVYAAEPSALKTGMQTGNPTFRKVLGNPFRFLSVVRCGIAGAQKANGTRRRSMENAASLPPAAGNDVSVLVGEAEGVRGPRWAPSL